MKRTIAMAILAAAVLGLLTACIKQDEADDPAPLQTGWGDAPDIAYSTFDGAAHKLSDHHGKPLVVNFWAAWCPPCKNEMPEFEEVYKKYEGQFDLIAIAVDNRQDPVGFFNTKGFSFTGATGGRDVSKYVTSVIPVTAFIDRNGNLVHKQDGGISGAVFEGHLKKIL